MESFSIAEPDSLPARQMDSVPAVQPPPRLIRLSVAFGFAQGSCNNVYLSAAGYYGAMFGDSRFFIWMCASVYIAPMLIFPFAFYFDAYFDRKLGVRKVFPFRLAFTLVLAACLIVFMGTAEIGRGTVLTLGCLLGILTGAVANSSSHFFGVLSPQLVPWWFLGQTASGAYVNVVAQITKFQPSCSHTIVKDYFISGSAVAIIAALSFTSMQLRGNLEESFARHSELMDDGQNVEESSRPPTPQGGASAESICQSPFNVFVIFCQILAVTLNISLTSLANVLAHGDFALGQEIVLLKLLSDFIGRLLFYIIPAPRATPKSLNMHLALNWALQLLRFPLWACLFAHILQPWLSHGALIAIWIPFVTAGALGGSWLSAIGIQAVSPRHKRTMATSLQLAVYCGFFLGVIFAIVEVLIYHVDESREAATNPGVLNN